MYIEDLPNERFSYKDHPYLKYSNNNYILAVKDEDFPERNIIPILYNNNGDISEIFKDEMEKIVVVPVAEIGFSLSRFHVNEIIKISNGDVRDNDRYGRNSSLPKCKIIDSYLYSVEQNDLVEIFDGKIDESKSRIKTANHYLDSIILDVYLEKDIPIFIQTNDAVIIGPFKIIDKDTEGYFNVEKSTWKTFAEYKVEENSYIEFTVNDVTRKIHIPPFNNLQILNIIDFKDDRELIKEFKTKALESSEIFDVEEQERLLKTLNKTLKINSVKNYVENNERIKTILEKTKDILTSNKELAIAIPKIQSVKEKIEILKNQELELNNNIENFSSQKEEIEKEFLKKQEQLQKLNEELKDLQETKRKELSKEKSELEGKIDELKDEKNNLERFIKDKTIEKSKEIEELRKELDVLRKDESNINAIISTLEIENQNIHKQSQQELINIFRNKRYFDFFIGRDLSDFEKKSVQEIKNYSVDENLYENYIDFKKKVVEILNTTGRKFESHFVDNLLLSLHQNTLTIFAGLPGTGKTSLARIITKILSPSERITEVSVNRGWTSQKDLIGFQNPLTNKFHSASTGVYEILCQLDDEVKENIYQSSPLAYIILDEANLSPMEHYWSTFYNLTDSRATENNYLQISLGNKLNLNYANNLRFIATINYDQTTENLSPRVIDRANIIQIPNIDVITNDITANDIENLKISYNKCIEFFNLPDFNPNNGIGLELTEEVK
jgi:hypothetical protein